MNRRQFLRIQTVTTTALALGVVGGATVSCGARRGRRRDLRLCASSILFKDLTLEQAVGRIAGVGFEAIDLWGAYDGCRHLDEAATRLGGGGLRELLSRHRLQLGACTLPAGGWDPYLPMLGEAGGGVAIQASPAGAGSEGLTERMRAFVDGLRPVADLAASHNVRLAVANQTDALLNSLDSIRAFTELNTHPNLGIALAPYHLQAIGVPVAEGIRAAGPQLFFFYAWQQGAGLKQLPGHGPADFRPWLDALAQGHYRGYLNLILRGYVEPDALSAALARSRNSLLYPA